MCLFVKKGMRVHFSASSMLRRLLLLLLSCISLCTCTYPTFLVGLTSPNGEIKPPFHPNTYKYTLTVNKPTNHVEIIPIPDWRLYKNNAPPILLVNNHKYIDLQRHPAYVSTINQKSTITLQLLNPFNYKNQKRKIYQINIVPGPLIFQKPTPRIHLIDHQRYNNQVVTELLPDDDNNNAHFLDAYVPNDRHYSIKISCPPGTQPSTFHPEAEKTFHRRSPADEERSLTVPVKFSSAGMSPSMSLGFFILHASCTSSKISSMVVVRVRRELSMDDEFFTRQVVISLMHAAKPYLSFFGFCDFNSDKKTLICPPVNPDEKIAHLQLHGVNDFDLTDIEPFLNDKSGESLFKSGVKIDLGKLNKLILKPKQTQPINMHNENDENSHFDSCESKKGILCFKIDIPTDPSIPLIGAQKVIALAQRNEKQFAAASKSKSPEGSSSRDAPPSSSSLDEGGLLGYLCTFLIFVSGVSGVSLVLALFRLEFCGYEGIFTCLYASWGLQLAVILIDLEGGGAGIGHSACLGFLLGLFSITCIGEIVTGIYRNYQLHDSGSDGYNCARHHASVSLPLPCAFSLSMCILRIFPLLLPYTCVKIIYILPDIAFDFKFFAGLVLFVCMVHVIYSVFRTYLEIYSNEYRCVVNKFSHCELKTTWIRTNKIKYLKSLDQIHEIPNHQSTYRCSIPSTLAAQLDKNKGDTMEDLNFLLKLNQSDELLASKLLPRFIARSNAVSQALITCYINRTVKKNKKITINNNNRQEIIPISGRSDDRITTQQDDPPSSHDLLGLFVCDSMVMMVSERLLGFLANYCGGDFFTTQNPDKLQSVPFIKILAPLTSLHHGSNEGNFVCYLNGVRNPLGVEFEFFSSVVLGMMVGLSFEWLWVRLLCVSLYFLLRLFVFLGMISGSEGHLPLSMSSFSWSNLIFRWHCALQCVMMGFIFASGGHGGIILVYSVFALLLFLGLFTVNFKVLSVVFQPEKKNRQRRIAHDVDRLFKKFIFDTMEFNVPKIVRLAYTNENSASDAVVVCPVSVSPYKTVILSHNIAPEFHSEAFYVDTLCFSKDPVRIFNIFKQKKIHTEIITHDNRNNNPYYWINYISSEEENNLETDCFFKNALDSIENSCMIGNYNPAILSMHPIDIREWARQVNNGQSDGVLHTCSQEIVFLGYVMGTKLTLPKVTVCVRKSIDKATDGPLEGEGGAIGRLGVFRKLDSEGEKLCVSERRLVEFVGGFDGQKLVEELRRSQTRDGGGCIYYVNLFVSTGDD